MRTDDDLDPLVSRRRKRKAAASRRRALVVGGAVAFAAVAAIVLVVVTAVRTRREAEVALAAAEAGARGARPPGLTLPSPAGEGESWDHNELAAYLRSRGVEVRSQPSERNSFYGPVCLFTPTGRRDDPAELHVQKWPTAQAAKDQAAATQQPAFVWGRFVFSGGPGAESYAGGVRAALGAR